MPVIKLKPGQLAGVFKGNSKRARRAVEAGAKLAAQRGRSLLVSKSPVDMGQLKNAWRVRKIGDTWTLINEAPHAGVMEAGARPHPVSAEGREALAQWVRRHIPVVAIGRGPNKGTKRLATRREASGVTEKSPGVFAPDATAAAINRIVDAICHRLETKGYVGKFFVRDSLPDLKRFVGEEIAEAMKRHVGGIGGGSPGGVP